MPKIKKIELRKDLEAPTSTFALSFRRDGRFAKPKVKTREEDEGEVEEETAAKGRGHEDPRKDMAAKSTSDDFIPITMRTRERLDALKKPNFAYRSNLGRSGDRSDGAGDAFVKDDEDDDVKPEFMDASKRREERSIVMATMSRDAGDAQTDRKPSLINTRHLNRTYSHFTGDGENMEDSSSSEDDDSFFRVGLKRVNSKESNYSNNSNDSSLLHPSLKERTIDMAEHDVHIHHHLREGDLNRPPVSGNNRRHIYENFNDVQFDHAAKNRTKLSLPEQQVRNMLRVHTSSVDFSMDSRDDSRDSGSSQSP